MASPCYRVSFSDTQNRTLSLRKEERWILLALGIASSLWIFLHIQSSPHAGKPRSTLATIEAIADRGTFSIEDSAFFPTNDSVRIGDHFVSPKPPVLSVLGAGVYALYRDITGVSFASHPSHVAVMLTMIFGWFPHVLLLLLFAHFILSHLSSPRARVAAFAGLNVSYIGVLYATEFQNHTVAAFLTFAAFLLAHNIRTGQGSSWNLWILTGFLSGLLIAVDLPMGAFTAGLFFYLFGANKQKACFLFFPAAALPVAAHSILSFLTTGEWISAELRPDLFLYEGSYWLNPGWFDLHDDPMWLYLWHMTFGHHGIFSMSPVLLFGAIELVRQIQQRGTFHAESLLVGVPFATVSLFYLFSRTQYGGLAVGYRWLIPFMPLLFLFFGMWMERNAPRWKEIMVIALLIFGFFHTYGNPGPFVTSLWERLFL